ncbi:MULTISPECIES: C40 family peptidase [Paenibacillus]|uniref:Hydrolase n=1 Tax=Paenibacillus campinasensis TaxID=66347 RepID=A0A268F1Z2_9BACL|nr:MULTISPECIES: C40 family peptidase [Paenibacillus]MUG65901.1 NlpC/P60 family protein [Paenibacillus campinasensis]PAD79363.1 hydrolase [Paenibacillus campinasensis]PAK51694.1 hydrolase [Paenibacillus sp. 7541]
MTRHNWAKKAVVISLSAAMGFGALLTVAPATPVEAASTSKGSQVVNFGKKYMGTPYKFGASTSTTKVFDCSSFMKHIFKKYGVDLPRTSAAQSKVGKAVSRSNLRTGDLVFFSSGSRSNGSNVTHVAVYMGNGKILHTYGKPGVTISNLNSGTWNKTYVKARRVL